MRKELFTVLFDTILRLHSRFDVLLLTVLRCVYKQSNQRPTEQPYTAAPNGL